MSEKLKVNDQYATSRAIELTKLAIENNMITASSDSQETADYIYDFCNRLYLQFTGQVNDQDKV